MAFDTKLTKLEGNIDYEKLKKKILLTLLFRSSIILYLWATLQSFYFN